MENIQIKKKKFVLFACFFVNYVAYYKIENEIKADVCVTSKPQPMLRVRR